MKESIGFKEWQVVCDALASGRQSILLRKGGIHEGRLGFSFAHEEFFLFPTRFHVLADQVREGVVTTKPEWKIGESIHITHHAEVLWAVTLTDWQRVQALEPLQIYSEITVQDRFNWEGKEMKSGSIHLALVRVRKLALPWELPYEARYGGCRSWVNLPEPPQGWRENSRPVVDDETFATIVKRLNAYSF